MTQVIHKPSAQTVRAGVNERQFFANMKNMFASSFSFLGELMQNARRAGASRVEVTVDKEAATLQVRDDGSGVEDFQVLITLAQSGWDEETTQTERPFGMGLFSALFAATELTIRSRGKRLAITLEDVVEKRDLAVKTDDFAGPGTLIEMRGVDPKLLAFEHEIAGYFGAVATPVLALGKRCRRFAEGFAIPVFFNDEELSRPHAQANLPGVQTPIGFVHLPTIHDAGAAGNYADAVAKGLSFVEARLYLQGLPVQRTDVDDRYEALRPVVHLDATQFSPKMPDRAYLVDYDKARKRITTTIEQVVREWTEAEKARLTEREFALRFWALCTSKGWVDLLNDVPYIPAAELEGNFPMRIDQEWLDIDRHPGIVREGESKPDPLISRDDIESGRVVVWTHVPSTIEENEAITGVDIAVANALGVYAPRAYRFPEGHWLHDIAPSLLDMRYELEPVNPGASAKYTGSYNFDSVIMTLVDAVKVVVTHCGDKTFRKEVLINDTWVLAPTSFSYVEGAVEESGDAVVYLPPPGECYQDPVDALCSYLVDDCYSEDWRNQDASLWDGIESTLRGAEMSKIVTTALVDSVHGRPLEAHMGQMVVVSGALQRSHTGSQAYRQWSAADINADLIARVASAFDAAVGTTAQRLQHALDAVVKPGQEKC